MNASATKKAYIETKNAYAAKHQTYSTMRREQRTTGNQEILPTIYALCAELDAERAELENMEIELIKYVNSLSRKSPRYTKKYAAAIATIEANLDNHALRSKMVALALQII